MAAVPSLRESAKPLVVYETGFQSSTTNVSWLSLADIKQHLRVDLEEAEFDSLLVKSMQDAFGYLERRTGLSFSERARVAEMSGVCPAVRVLSLDVPFATITAVKEVDETGAVSTLGSADYEVVYSDNCPLIRLTREEAFSPHGATWARVEFTTAIPDTSPVARRLRALVRMMVKQDFDGMEPGRDCRNSKEFLSAISSLRDTSGTYRAFR